MFIRGVLQSDVVVPGHVSEPCDLVAAVGSSDYHPGVTIIWRHRICNDLPNLGFFPCGDVLPFPHSLPPG